MFCRKPDGAKTGCAKKYRIVTGRRHNNALLPVTTRRVAFRVYKLQVLCSSWLFLSVVVLYSMYTYYYYCIIFTVYTLYSTEPVPIYVYIYTHAMYIQ